MSAYCDIREFIRKLSEGQKIYIYGTGYIANIFFDILKEKGFQSQVGGFVVSQIMGNQENMKELPVYSINRLSVGEDILICIAVHESLKREIESILMKKGVLNYMWIYPFLFELHYGNPVRDDKWIDIKKIIPGDRDEYGIAIRWVAIDDYYGKCSDGFQMYKKAMTVNGNMDTVTVRINNFRKLIQNWDNLGYEPEHKILINTNYEIIDGEHRTALALYHGKRQICCKIYQGKNIHREEALMTKKALLKKGFIQQEFDRLDKINSYIRNLIL